jgi:hypothetical protein
MRMGTTTSHVLFWTCVLYDDEVRRHIMYMEQGNQKPNLPPDSRHNNQVHKNTPPCMDQSTYWRCSGEPKPNSRRQQLKKNERVTVADAKKLQYIGSFLSQILQNLKYSNLHLKLINRPLLLLYTVSFCMGCMHAHSFRVFHLSPVPRSALSLSLSIHWCDL